MQSSQPKKPDTSPTKPRKKRQKAQTVEERLSSLRRLFVQSAAWNSEGQLTGVVFFPPTMVLETRRAEMGDQIMNTQGPEGRFDETPEMKHLRERAEDPHTDAETAEHLASKYRRLAQERMAYYSS